MIRISRRLILRARRAHRLWRHAPHPRRWWLVWEVSQRVAEAAWRRIPVYMAAVKEMQEEQVDAAVAEYAVTEWIGYGEALSEAKRLARASHD